MIKELVEKTRSYRSFKPDAEIEESVLLELVDVARKCSAAMNAQPLKYKIVTEKAERDSLFAITRWAGKLGIKLFGYFLENIFPREMVASNAPVIKTEMGVHRFPR